MKLEVLFNNHAHYCDEIFRIIMQSIYSTIMKIKIRWWGISVNHHATFHGITYFKRVQNSYISIGKNCTFLSKPTSNKIGLYCPCMLSTATQGATLTIGNNCGFSGTRIWAAKSITIGNNVRCGANTLITDTDAHTNDSRAGMDSPVIIEDNVWLGMNVMVLKGVHIGKGSIIGAGSIVTKNIPTNVVAAGIPCKVIKELSI